MIVVTGATGHIGNVLVRELLAKGEHVRVVVPQSEDTTPIDGLDVDIVTGDVRDIQSIIAAFTDSKVVYHLAGIISILPGKKKLLRDVNVMGTKNIVEACLKTGVERLVYVSSIHAIKEPPHGVEITESQPYDPSSVLGDYAKSKALATLEVIKGVNRGLNAVIVCPTGVIGPYDFNESEMGHLIKEFLDKRLNACVDGAYDFVDVRDVVRGMILACEKGRSGEGYILSGGQITIRNLYTVLENITEIKAPKFQVSCGVARAIGIVITPFYMLSKVKPLFTKYSIDVLASNSLVSSEKAKRELGYSVRPIRESLADSVIWFKEHSMKCLKLDISDDICAAG
jgi:dihydroflavonol-4-reductase